MAVVQYNRIIRKLVLGFGNLFNNITLVRYNPDESEAQRFIVPIAYAAKELYVQRLEGDPNLDKKVQITLPRLSYELTNFSYDASRKQNTNTKNFLGGMAQYNPVPYNFDFSLYLYVRNIEDGTQIIEHILPFFTPDYTIKLNLIPEMGISKEIPIVLNSTTQEMHYEGPRESDTRMIIWTLNFTAKGFIFGNTNMSNLITNSITNIYTNITSQDVVDFTLNPTSGTGSYRIGELVYQGFSTNTSVATGVVVNYDSLNNILSLSNINGNFISTYPIVGSATNASYSYTSFNLEPSNYAKISVTPNPPTANVNSAYTANTVITENNN